MVETVLNFRPMRADAKAAATEARSAPRYQSVQIARAIAALLVACVHVLTISSGLDGTAYAHSAFQFGQAGVDIFFVISGYIIAEVAQRSRDARQFAARRLVRILPFYWIVTVLVLTLQSLKGGSFPPAGQLLSSLLLLPQAELPVLGVGWSLEHELIFYAVAALAIAVGAAHRLLLIMAGLSAASILWALASGGGVDDLFHVLSLFHVEFLIGVVAYTHRRRLARLPWRPLLLLAALCFPLSAAVLHVLHQAVVPLQPTGALGLLRVILWGGASMMLLSGLIACEAQAPSLMNAAPLRLLASLGSASFALYLLHPIVFELFEMAVGTGWTGPFPYQAMALVAISLAVGVASLFYHFVERPVMSRLISS